MRPPSFWELLLILVIVVLLFGTKKLKNIGTDLGGAIKGFRASMHDGEESVSPDQAGEASHGQVIDGDKMTNDGDKPKS
jgi:sec-independent protein translocase protein TatA